MILFVGVRAKIYAYLMNDDSEHKKVKGTKKCIIKRRLMVKNYEDCLFNNKIILNHNKDLKSDCRNVYTEEINKIALSSNDDKRLQTFNKITTYPYGTNATTVCESEMMLVRGFFVKNCADCSFYYEVISIQNKTHSKYAKA